MNGILTAVKGRLADRRCGRRRINRSRLGNLGVVIFLVLICGFILLPVVYSVVQSLKPVEEIFAFPPRFFVRNPTLSNFRQALKLADSLWVPFSRYVFNTLFVAVAGTVLVVIISSMAAYSLAKARFFGSVLLAQMIVWMLLFRGEVTAVSSYVIVSKLGMMDTYWALIIPTLGGTTGVFLIKQFIHAAIPDSTLEAARIDGASEYRVFFQIVVPGIRPAMLTVVILTFQSMWNATSPYIYSENLKQLSNVISTIVAGGIARQGAASAATVLMMIPTVLLFLVSQRSVMQTMTHSGLK